MRRWAYAAILILLLSSLAAAKDKSDLQLALRL